MITKDNVRQKAEAMRLASDRRREAEAYRNSPEGRRERLRLAAQEKREREESELRERREARRVELLARERELAGYVENIDFNNDPRVLAQNTAELAAVRRILATIPEPEATAAPRPQLTREQSERIQYLKEQAVAARREADHIRAHQVATINQRLRQPFDTRNYTPPRISPSMSPSEAQARINDAYDTAKGGHFDALRQQRTNLLARAGELEREAERMEAEVLRLESNA